MNPDESGKFGLTDLMMLMTILFWGVNFSMVKLALREFSPYGFNGIRLSTASIILIVILWIRKDGLFLRRSDWSKIVILAFIGNTLYQILFIHGINLTTASNTSLIMASTPIFIALLSSSLKHERIHWSGWLGIFLSFLGLYLIITRRAGAFEFSWQNLRGDGLILLGNICWTIYTVLSKPLLARIPPFKYIALSLALGSLFFLPFAAPDLKELPWEGISERGWLILAYSSIFAIALGYAIWYASVKRVGNTKTSIYGNFTPVIAVVSAHFLVGERITTYQVIGALIIFAGFYLTRSGYRWFVKAKPPSC